MTTRDKRAERPPVEAVREAPFALRGMSDGEPNDGFTLDGFAAVFNSLTTIDSWEGCFREQVAPGSMKRSFKETPPVIQFDHGRHPLVGSIPIAELRSVTEDVDPVLAPNGGAHVIGRVFDNWLMEPVRNAISAQAVKGMSFRFGVVRESWTYADGRPIKDDQALMAELDRTYFGDVDESDLPIRTLKELKVPELGPVVFPAYMDTSVGMRSKVIDLGRLSEPSHRKLLARAVFMADEAATTAQDAPVRATEADDDPAALAAGLDAVLDQASSLLAGVDMSSLPPEVAQACALITAAETASDALLEAMGIDDPDDDETDEGRSKDVGTQRSTGITPVGERLPEDDAQRSTSDEKPSPVGEHPSKPRNLSQRELRLRNQRDRLLTLRAIGDRPL